MKSLLRRLAVTAVTLTCGFVVVHCQPKAAAEPKDARVVELRGADPGVVSAGIVLDDAWMTAQDFPLTFEQTALSDVFAHGRNGGRAQFGKVASWEISSPGALFDRTSAGEVTSFYMSRCTANPMPVAGVVKVKTASGVERSFKFESSLPCPEFVPGKAPEAISATKSPAGEVPPLVTGLQMAIAAQFPSQATLQASEQYLVVVRSSADTPDPCADFASKGWAPGAYKGLQGAALVDLPADKGRATSQTVYSPVPEGEVGVLVYVLGAKSAVCQNDKWCGDWNGTGLSVGDTCTKGSGDVGLCAPKGTAPKFLAGGCAKTTLVPGQVANLQVTLTPAPAQAPGATCTDGAKNGAETDVDCGGGACPKCADGKACAADTDCATSCDAATKTCKASPAGCTDGLKNGTETDVDCGGDACVKCADAKACVEGPRDCASGVCAGAVCAAPTPTDGVKNGAETDVDCGGGVAPKCADTKGCANGARDCVSGVCTGALCDAPSFTDGVKNGAETDVDCGGGGGAPLCANTKVCTDGPRDCASGVCTGGVCVTE